MEAVHNVALKQGPVLEKDLFHDELLRRKVRRSLHRPMVCSVCLQVRDDPMLHRGAPELYLLDEEYGRHPDEVFHSFRYLQRFEHFVVHDQFHLSVLDVRVLAPRTRRSFRWD